jgi:glucosyl-dolichyl phosphate glucuronosyltransferase
VSDAFDVSVVISTFNRCELLPRSLESVLAQNAEGCRYEVLIVDNNSTDRTRSVLESYEQRAIPNFRHFFEPRQGVSFGRNTGIAAARAPIVAFTDDDLLPAPDWVLRIKRALDAHPEVAYVGGRVLPSPGQQFPAWLTRRHWNPLMLHDPGEASFYVGSANPVGMGSGNLAVRSDVLREFEGFSTAFPRGQDRELQLRLWRAGRRGLYLPALQVFSEVQADRLTKRYHRRCYRTEGEVSAAIRDPDVERASARLFDVPAHLYRQAALDAWNLLWLRVRGRGDEAFLAELHLRFFAAFFRKRREAFLRAGEQGSLANLVSFLRALWAR